MPMFRKRPLVVEAEQFDSHTRPLPFQTRGIVLFSSDVGFHLETSEGVMRLHDGDWVIKGIKGEFYPCKPDVFAKTYEPVVESP